MLRLIRVLLALAGIIVIACLAVANRDPVDVSLWPLPLSYSPPLYLFALVCLLLGALLMAMAGGLSGLASFFRASRDRRRVAAFEEQERLRQEQAERAEVERVRERRRQLALANAGSPSSAVTVSSGSTL
jgi:lipopolysaccharide assembly protein A